MSMEQLRTLMEYPSRRTMNKKHKRAQREKQQRWLMKNYGVSTAEALVSKLMKG